MLNGVFFVIKKMIKSISKRVNLLKVIRHILKMDLYANVENDNLDYVWYEKIFVTFLRDDKCKKTISLVKLLLFLTRFKSSSLFKYPILNTFFNHRENSQLLNRKEYARQVLSPVLSWHLQFPDLYPQLFNSLMTMEEVPLILASSSSCPSCAFGSCLPTCNV